MRFLVFLFCLVAAGFPSAAFANDSFAEIAVGGLELKQSDNISLDKEDLYLSEKEVRVDYLFTNHAATDQDILVAFPLPDLVFNDESPRGPVDYAKDLNFETTVDGAPVKYELVQQAFLNGKDVTAELHKAGLPLDGSIEDFSGLVRKLAPAAVADLVKGGFLDESKDDQNSYYMALWSLRTSVTRHQVFPAGKTVSVHHRYVPLVGGSVGGNLDKGMRNEDWARDHAKSFCIDPGWFKAFDKLEAQKKTADNTAPYGEIWLSYVLSSGANWKGPIKDFRMVIDKGKPDDLVSFCAEGVKKIAPSQFEVRIKDFEPKDDVKILIVHWAEQ